MAAKVLHSLTDDNLDLQKQIGCMNGIFHLFDRHHILTGGGRRVAGHGHGQKGLHHQDFNGATSEGECNDEHLRAASTDKNPFKNVHERLSTESSRASFSTLSRSSSSSSLDCIRAATHLEPASFDRIIFPSRDPAMSFQSSSPQFSRQNRDIRDLVKDSMYREIHDSPRLHSQITNASPHASVLDDLKESLRAAAKLQEVAPPKHHNERRHLGRSLSYHSRDEYPSLVSRDAPPRFSCDGREANNCAAFDSRDVSSKSTLKLKDLPRLSLDGSKAGAARSLRSMQQQDSGDQFDHGKVQNQARPPSVVAKLMGLEALPHSVSPIDTSSSVTRSYPDRGDRSSVTPTSTSKNPWKEPTSPRWRNPVEPAPWKHTEGRRSSQKPGSRTTRGAAKAESTAFPSVYSEVEKRLKDLEFTQSGKDLRALKQILEAMQSKKLLKTQNEVLGSNSDLRSKYEARISVVERQKLQNEEALASTKKGVVAARHTESPIVIMKPALKLQDNEFVDSRKGLSSGRTAKDLSSISNVKNETNLKVKMATQTSARSQNLAKDKSSGSISPRLLQKKPELERRARPPTPPDRSSKSRRQTTNKQLGNSNSPGGRRRPKHSSIQESGERLSETDVTESRNLNEKSSSCMNPSREGSESMLSVSIEQMPTIASDKEKSAEFGIVPVEHSSPVSVLDCRVHEYNSPSSLTQKVDKEKDSNTDNWREDGFKSEINQNKLQNIEHLVQKLRRLNSSHDEAGTDYIASLCENTDPDHRYISEILLASGLLLRDLGSSLTSFQFHHSGHPINPELFRVLEQTKASTVLLKEEECSSEKKTETMMMCKLRRKLVFDTVNEILARKLVPAGPSTEPWRLRRHKLTRTALNAQRLLREVCSEVEAVGDRDSRCSSGGEDEQWKGVVCEDVMRHHESECWTDFDGEISGAVLDVERSIFKDLVNEIVIGESHAASGLKTKTSR